MKTIFSILKRNPVRIILVFNMVLVGLSSCSKKSSSDYPTGNPPPGGGSDSSKEVQYTGSFVKSSNDVSTQATGSVTATFDTASLKLSYTLSWNYLTTPPVGMHIHDNGPIIVPITGFPATADGSFSGSATLTASQAADLAAGKLYAQIHTQTYPAGEILATLTRK